MLTVHPLTADRWDDLTAFFGPSGAYSGCWCTWWRQTGAQYSAGCHDGAVGNRDLLGRLTAEGRVPGLMAYDGEQPVGWVCVAPRPEFGRLLRSRALKPGPDEDPADPSVWSVVCFWVPRARRGQGVGTALLDAAMAHAWNSGARTVEGYPVPVDGRAPATDIFTGTASMFERAGFRPVSGSTGTRRKVQIVR